jgi:hypothetical protein
MGNNGAATTKPADAIVCRNTEYLAGLESKPWANTMSG